MFAIARQLSCSSSYPLVRFLPFVLLFSAVDVCVTPPVDSETADPTVSPTDFPTGKPTEDPTAKPTEEPTAKPTDDPTAKPTDDPTAKPTDDPTAKPTDDPTASPIVELQTAAPVTTTSGCECDAGNSDIGSWKCGNNVYVCPGIDQICQQNGNNGSTYYKINQAQCDAMKSIELTDSCVLLPQYGITGVQGIGLSHRVCYAGNTSYKNDGSCSECKNFKIPPWEHEITAAPTPVPTNQLTSTASAWDCASLSDLGEGFSKATEYSGCYPPITGGPNWNNLPGYDDGVAVFVGGNMNENTAAEVEGNVVVMGDLVVGSSGPSNFVSVGVGTHVLPRPGGDCVKVGGSVVLNRDVQVFNQASWMQCDLVYKGSASNAQRWKTSGAVRHDPNYDLSFYEKMMYVWEKKSKYWKTLPSTGTVSDSWGTTQYTCSNKNEIQVFNILATEHSFLSTHTIDFSDDCEGKTILINVHGSGSIDVQAAAMHWNDRMGYGAGGFPTCMTESMLWNFPDASSVNIGAGRTSEFHGSLLVTGDMQLTTSGHSGRVVVLGSVTHNRGGSEFHTYQYNPPISLPDPQDVCVIPADSYEGGIVGDYPTQAPTNPPTNAPTTTPDKCLALPNSGVKDKKCAKCQPPNGYEYWPCNTNPRKCYGNCEFH